MTTPENSSNDEQEKEEVICYSKLAREGISLMLNNKQNEAEILFKSYPQSIQMNAGYAFAVFTDALMTFEDEKLQLALQSLKDLEKKCSAYTGWMRSMRSRMFGTETNTQVEQLESQIILADSHVFVATLTFLQQDITGYFKGGWILRKAYKHYQHAYNEILVLYKEIVGDENIPIQSNEKSPPSQTQMPDVSADPAELAAQSVQDPSSLSLEEFPIAIPAEAEEITLPDPVPQTTQFDPVPETTQFDPVPEITQSNPVLCQCGPVLETIQCDPVPEITQSDPVLKTTQADSPVLEGPKDIPSIANAKATSSIKNGKELIDKETISRLLCAVSFGYGLLQLGISLLPPSMLKLTNFLGFGGNRKNGLDNLMFARNGTDMRAPFARLGLLWYHTIVRPFFALDGNNVEAGVEVAAQLIEETRAEYSESALFLFFEGRVLRLNSDIPAAIRAFQTSIENSSQREIKMMSLHEVGWCYLILLDFASSEATFTCLTQSSRWSKSFYSYLTIISAGSNRVFEHASDVRETKHAFFPVTKGSQLDEFLNRRYKICPMKADDLKQKNCLFWKLLVYELLYLWNTLPSCTNESLHAIINDCEAALEAGCESMCGLAYLIQGSCFCILRRVSDGVERFRSCLEKRKDLPHNCDSAHISAFAHYELGLLLIRQKETSAEGKRLLQLAAYNYKDYDFEQRLSVRVHAILKTL